MSNAKIRGFANFPVPDELRKALEEMATWMELFVTVVGDVLSGLVYWEVRCQVLQQQQQQQQEEEQGWHQ